MMNAATMQTATNRAACQAMFTCAAAASTVLVHHTLSLALGVLLIVVLVLSLRGLLISLALTRLTPQPEQC